MASVSESLSASNGESVPHATCRVIRSDDDGWDVYSEVEGRLLSVTHCSDWHRVERVRAQLEARAAIPAARTH
jgi:hypothetical protein